MSRRVVMQPKFKMKKTLLASALILGLGNAFTASSETFNITAGAVPDVDVQFVGSNNSLSFGAGIIGNKGGESCSMIGYSGIADALLLLDEAARGSLGVDDAADVAGGYAGDEYGALGGGNACIADADGEASGTPVVIEIDGTDSSTVSVTVNDVTGAGYVWTPSAESCVVDFDRATTNVQDTCVSLAGNTVTGVGMSLTQVDGVNAANTELPATAIGHAAISGKTRMVLAGTITLDAGGIAAGTTINESLTVTVVYE